MALSEHGDYFSTMGPFGQDEFMVELCKAVEAVTESNHSLATKFESMQLRIEELEAQLTALAPPKSAGPVVDVQILRGEPCQ